MIYEHCCICGKQLTDPNWYLNRGGDDPAIIISGNIKCHDCQPANARQVNELIKRVESLIEMLSKEGGA